jgi:hypothetical protein
MEAVCIVSASNQNVFFEELLAAFEGALRRAGVRTERSVDCFPRLRDGLAYLFVPHEYLPLTMPEACPSSGQLQRTVAICTEQPGTTWFDVGAEIAELAAHALDINREGTRELRRRGIPADTIQLGYVPEWDRWGGDESRERPIDFTFMGGYGPRRGQVLASFGSVLAGRNAAIHLFDTSMPHSAESESFFAGDRKWDHLGRSKTILNIHRSPLAYLEWQRVLGAIVNGCVVVSEHSLGVWPLLPGEHFISTTVERGPAVLRALLDDEDRLGTVRRNAYEFLRGELPIDAGIDVLLNALEDAAATDIGASPRGALQPLPRPQPPRGRTPEPVRIAKERSEMDVIRMALKQLVLNQVEGRRMGPDPGAPAEDRVERFGDSNDASSRVSVVLTVYNYENYVTEAIASVAASDHDSFELVVVEDASLDDSLETVRRAVQKYPWVPTTLVARGRNGGLAAARNLGIEHARGEYVFILDADNAVYPHCLSALARALEDDPDAAMAYGILEAFDHAGPKDLLSWLAWDPYRFRFDNYIDAMAMLRKSAVQAVGGYTSDRRLYGWEDFALWCEFANRGMRGVSVPQIVARYRSGLATMISITDIDASDAWSALTERYPILSAPNGAIHPSVSAFPAA